jgi:periplasmic protein TonB
MPSESAVRVPADHVAPSVLPPYLIEDPRERRGLRLAVAAALACHLPLLLLPDLGASATAAPEIEEPPAIVLRTTRFRPPVEPPTPPERRPPREERAVRVPIPDPTPTEPEPLRELELPPIDPLPERVIVFPAPPEPSEPEAAPAEVLRVGGVIARPRQLHAPRPGYTEAARRVRIQGPVILEVQLDEHGAVGEVSVLRGQPFGLTESAVAAVSRWRYEPARLGGRAVPVLMTVTINFELF